MWMRISSVAFLAAGLCAGSAWGQQKTAQSKTTAREMYFAGWDDRPAGKQPSKSGPAVKSAAKSARAQNAKSVVPPTATGSAASVAPLPVRSTPSQIPGLMPASFSIRAPLGLRYAVLKIAGQQSTEMPPGTVFHSGDRIRVRIQANDEGYLYIVHQGSSGKWRIMFPSPEIQRGNNRIEKGREFDFPPGKVFTFYGQPGTEKLFIVLSRQPEPDLDRLIYALKGDVKATPPEQPAPEKPATPMLLASLSPVEDGVVDRFRRTYSRDLMIEEIKDEEAAPKAEKAVYVVNPTGRADSRVVADILLIHQ